MGDAYAAVASLASEAPKASFDPIPDRDHAWLFVPTKRTEDCPTLKTVVYNWVSSVYGASKAERCKDAINSMADSRARAVEMSQVTVAAIREQDVHTPFDKTYFPAVVNYCLKMQKMLSKTAGTSSGYGFADFDFTWHHYTLKTNSGGGAPTSVAGDETASIITTGSLRFDVICNLFNLAAMSSMLGAMLPERLRQTSNTCVVPYMPKVSAAAAAGLPGRTITQENDDCIAMRCGRFRTSAQLFQMAADLARKWGIACDEVTPDIFEAMSALMLAQAQECTYRDFKHHYTLPTAAMDSAQRAKTASQYYLTFLNSYDMIATSAQQTSTPVHIPELFAVHCTAVRTSLRAALISHWIEGNFSSPDQYGMFVGQAARCLRISDEAIEIIKSFFGGGGDSYVRYVADIQDLRERCAIRYGELEQENRDVMKKQVPATGVVDNAIAMEGADMVALKALDATNVKNESLKRLMLGSDESFSCITSAAASNAWVKYRATLASGLAQLAAEMGTFYKLVASLIAENPHYLLLYFIAHKLGAGGTACLLPENTPLCTAGALIRGQRWSDFVSDHSQCERASAEAAAENLALQKVLGDLKETRDAAEAISDKLRERVTAIAALIECVSTTRERSSFAETLKLWDSLSSSCTAYVRAQDNTGLKKALGATYGPELYEHVVDIAAIIAREGVDAPQAAVAASPKPPSRPGLVSTMMTGLGLTGSSGVAPLPIHRLPDSSVFKNVCVRLVALIDSVCGTGKQGAFDAPLDTLRQSIAELDTEVIGAEVGASVIDSWIAEKSKWMLTTGQDMRNRRQRFEREKKELDDMDGIGLMGASKVIGEKLGYTGFTEGSITAFADCAAVIFVTPMAFSYVRSMCGIVRIVARRCVDDSKACIGQSNDFTGTVRIARERERRAAAARDAAQAAENSASASGRRGGYQQQQQMQQQQHVAHPPRYEPQSVFTLGDNQHVLIGEQRPFLPPLGQASSSKKGV